MSYIIKYYADLMTDEEKLAYRHLFGLSKIAQTSSASIKFRVKSDLCTEDLDILNLLGEGEEEFYIKVAKRILHDNQEKVFLNYCPKCGALARTPKAQQCKSCGLDWHKT